MGHHLVELAKGPAWDHARGRREQPGWDEHAAFMEVLVADGFILLGGPTGPGDNGNAVLVVDAHDELAVRARLAGDPWLGSVLEIESVRPWSIWLRG
jgi:uncharacterized protein YciI